MGISLFGRRKAAPAKDSSTGPPAPEAPPAPAATDGKERLTANDWARRLQLNEVMAERAAMRAGRWHDLFTQEEFLELIKRADV